MKFDEFRRQWSNSVRKPPSDEEHRIQTACVRWFRLKYPHLFARLFAVPNGGRRDGVTGARLKAEGVLAGVADLILLVPNAGYHALLIEMKTPKGRQSESQRAWQRQWPVTVTTCTWCAGAWRSSYGRLRNIYINKYA